ALQQEDRQDVGEQKRERGQQQLRLEGLGGITLINAPVDADRQAGQGLQQAFGGDQVERARRPRRPVVARWIVGVGLGVCQLRGRNSLGRRWRRPQQAEAVEHLQGGQDLGRRGGIALPVTGQLCGL